MVLVTFVQAILCLNAYLDVDRVTTTVLLFSLACAVSEGRLPNNHHSQKYVSRLTLFFSRHIAVAFTEAGTKSSKVFTVNLRRSAPFKRAPLNSLKFNEGPGR